MPNICSFRLRVKGKQCMIADFVAILCGDGPMREWKEDEVEETFWSKTKEKRKLHLTKDFIGRCYVNRIVRPKLVVAGDEITCLEVFGECSWDISGSMVESHHGIADLSKELGITIEVWGDEPCSGFREHYCFGEIAEREGKVCRTTLDYERFIGMDEIPKDEWGDPDEEKYRKLIDSRIPMVFECVTDFDFMEDKDKRVLPDPENKICRERFVGVPSWKYL